MSTWSEIPSHPFFIHFPIGLWLAGTLWWTAGWLARKETWKNAAWWMLIAGALVTFPAVLSGQSDYSSLTKEAASLPLMERHRDLGNLLAWLMLAILLLRTHVVLKGRSSTIPDGWWAPAIWLITAILILTSLWGGQLVYIHGYGVRTISVCIF